MAACVKISVALNIVTPITIRTHKVHIHIAVVGQVSAHEADIGHSLAVDPGHSREQEGQSQYSELHILSQRNE